MTLSDVLLPLIVPRPAKAVPTFTLPNHFFVSGEEVSYAHTDRRTGV